MGLLLTSALLIFCAQAVFSLKGKEYFEKGLKVLKASPQITVSAPDTIEENQETIFGAVEKMSSWDENTLQESSGGSTFIFLITKYSKKDDKTLDNFETVLRNEFKNGLPSYLQGNTVTSLGFHFHITPPKGIMKRRELHILVHLVTDEYTSYFQTGHKNLLEIFSLLAPYDPKSERNGLALFLAKKYLANFDNLQKNPPRLDGVIIVFLAKENVNPSKTHSDLLAEEIRRQFLTGFKNENIDGIGFANLVKQSKSSIEKQSGPSLKIVAVLLKGDKSVSYFETGHKVLQELSQVSLLAPKKPNLKKNELALHLANKYLAVFDNLRITPPNLDGAIIMLLETKNINDFKKYGGFLEEEIRGRFGNGLRHNVIDGIGFANQLQLSTTSSINQSGINEKIVVVLLTENNYMCYFTTGHKVLHELLQEPLLALDDPNTERNQLALFLAKKYLEDFDSFQINPPHVDGVIIVFLVKENVNLFTTHSDILVEEICRKFSTGFQHENIDGIGFANLGELSKTSNEKESGLSEKIVAVFLKGNKSMSYFETGHKVLHELSQVSLLAPNDPNLERNGPALHLAKKYLAVFDNLKMTPPNLDGAILLFLETENIKDVEKHGSFLEEEIRGKFSNGLQKEIINGIGFANQLQLSTMSFINHSGIGEKIVVVLFTEDNYMSYFKTWHKVLHDLLQEPFVALDDPNSERNELALLLAKKYLPDFASFQNNPPKYDGVIILFLESESIKDLKAQGDILVAEICSKFPEKNIDGIGFANQLQLSKTSNEKPSGLIEKIVAVLLIDDKSMSYFETGYNVLLKLSQVPLLVPNDPNLDRNGLALHLAKKYLADFDRLEKNPPNIDGVTIFFLEEKNINAFKRHGDILEGKIRCNFSTGSRHGNIDGIGFANQVQLSTTSSKNQSGFCEKIVAVLLTEDDYTSYFKTGHKVLLELSKKSLLAPIDPNSERNALALLLAKKYLADFDSFQNTPPNLDGVIILFLVTENINDFRTLADNLDAAIRSKFSTGFTHENIDGIGFANLVQLSQSPDKKHSSFNENIVVVLLKEEEYTSYFETWRKVLHQFLGKSLVARDDPKSERNELALHLAKEYLADFDNWQNSPPNLDGVIVLFLKRNIKNFKTHVDIQDTEICSQFPTGIEHENIDGIGFANLVQLSKTPDKKDSGFNENIVAVLLKEEEYTSYYKTWRKGLHQFLGKSLVALVDPKSERNELVTRLRKNAALHLAKEYLAYFDYWQNSPPKLDGVIVLFLNRNIKNFKTHIDIQDTAIRSQFPTGIEHENIDGIGFANQVKLSKTSNESQSGLSENIFAVLLTDKYGYEDAPVMDSEPEILLTDEQCTEIVYRTLCTVIESKDKLPSSASGLPQQSTADADAVTECNNWKHGFCTHAFLRNKTVFYLVSASLAQVDVKGIRETDLRNLMNLLEENRQYKLASNRKVTGLGIKCKVMKAPSTHAYHNVMLIDRPIRYINAGKVYLHVVIVVLTEGDKDNKAFAASYKQVKK